MALRVFETRIVPRNVLSICQGIVQKRLAAKSSRSLVVLLRNDTNYHLHFDSHKFTSGKFLDGCSFPSVVPPMTTAIAGCYATGWMRGITGMAAFTLQDASVCLGFDCPVVGNFSPKAVIVPRAHVPADGSFPVRGSQVTAVKGRQIRVTVGAPGYNQVFSVCQRNRVDLSTHDISAIFDFLPPNTLRKAACITRAWRSMVSNLPPQRFYGLTRTFPDYRLPFDLDRTNWHIADDSRVRWSVKSEAAFHDERTVSFVDSSEQRIFFLTCDVFARAVECVVYYGSRKSPVASIEEGFFATARKTSLRVNGRTVATISFVGPRAELFIECMGRTKPFLTLERETEANHVIRTSDRVVVAQLLIHSKTSRRTSTVAELQLLRRSEALLCSILSFVALFRS
jgi:hypothetical protein